MTGSRERRRANVSAFTSLAWRRSRWNGRAEFFDRAQERGWVECVWRMQNEEVRTWFRGDDQHYQLDHVFCDGGLAQRLASVRVADDAAELLGLSDHAP